MSEANLSEHNPVNEKYGIADWLRSRDTLIALGLIVLCIVTRALAVPASMWELDDHNFARAIHTYDVMHHSPHPPGFPVFIVMLRAAYFFVRDDHRALLAVNFVFASLLGAVLFYLYQEIFEDHAIALAGALLGCFAPSLWVHSLIARSDTPNLVLGMITLTLIIRGLKSRRALLIGCVVFGLGMGVRVTLLPLVGSTLAMVLLLRLWKQRDWKSALAAPVIIGLCVLLWYVPMIWVTGWAQYRVTVAAQSKYISETDTIFQSLYTPAERFYGYFIDVWGEWNIAMMVYALAGLGILLLLAQRKWRAFGLILLAFVPFLVFTLLMNTPMGVIVYSMPYIPLFTGLIGCAVVLLPRLFFTTARWPLVSNVGVIVAIGLAIATANWSYPLIKLLRKEASPPVRAAQHILQKVDPEKNLLYFDKGLYAHARYYFPNYKREEWEVRDVPPLNLINPVENQNRIFAYTTEPIGQLPNDHFHWTPGRAARRLKTMSIGRFFDVYLTDVTDLGKAFYLSGWYQPERAGNQQWRWMGQQGKVALQSVADTMQLRFRGVAANIPNRQATITLKLDGKELARFTKREIDQSFTIKTNPEQLWSVLTIETDQTFVPKQTGVNSDERELGLQCFDLQWTNAPNAPLRAFTVDQFVGDGWYVVEQSPSSYFRWASDQAIVHLPPMEGDAMVVLKMQVPAQPDGSRAPVKVEVAGQEIETIQPPNDVFTKTIPVPAAIHKSIKTDLKLSTPRATSFPGDSRKLAMAVFRVNWLPAGEAKK